VQGSGGSGAWVAALGTDGLNNLDANPLFIDAAAGDVRLGSGSPAIDAGDGTAAAGVITDLDGLARVWGTQIDMGAYEYYMSVVDVGDDPIRGNPPRIALRAVYPNPGNRNFHVNFDLERRRSVRMSVHDVQGWLVRKVLDEILEAGRHTISWDGADETGNQARRGVYFLQLRSEEWSAHRKLILVN
jgi:hypothetical protein